MRKIPPLNALKVFESAARLGNLTKAAEELNVSQSAVSRQIALIESYLGVILFQREARGVSLTKLGEEYQREIGPAFFQIVAATEKLIQHEETLRVRAYTTFAAKWLLHHLPSFEDQYPNIKIEIKTGVKPADFGQGNQDISIEFMRDSAAGAHATKLFSDIIEPVCSPDVLKGNYRTDGFEHLQSLKILDSKYRTADWPEWISYAGASDAKIIPRAILPSSLLAYQAAAEGLGVAMGQIRLLQYELKKGILVTPFSLPLERPAGYYLLIAPKQEERIAVRVFKQWILGQLSDDMIGIS